MVHKLRDGSGVKVTMAPSSTHSMTTRRRRRAVATETPTEASATATATVSATTATASTNDAKKYRDRDAHELFFRPSTIVSMYNNNSSKTKKKKKKPKGWTDKQRAKEAHAHWIMHHGTAQDAKQFLNLKANTDNVTAETIATLLTTMSTNCTER